MSAPPTWFGTRRVVVAAGQRFAVTEYVEVRPAREPVVEREVPIPVCRTGDR